ncbi:MAG: signal peptidase I [Planctomycetota bacterium]|jgi:signal peptidase I
MPHWKRLLVPAYAQAANGQRVKAVVIAAVLLLVLLALATTPWVHTPAGLVSFFVLLGLGQAACLWDGRRNRSASGPARLAGRDRLILAGPLAALGLMLVLHAAGLNPFGVRAYRIPAGNESSHPTLRGDERFLADLRATDVERGALVIFDSPEDGAQTWIKRAVGLPGDVVRADTLGVHVNGRLVLGGAAEPFGPVTVESGSVFVVGDNVAGSRDSRHFGSIKKELIKGRPLYVFWSDAWNRIGTTLH